MTTLHERLREAVVKIKELAEAAPAGPWTVEPHYRPLQGCLCLTCYEDRPSGFEITELSAPPGHGPFVVFEDEAAVRHVSANDPTAVLRRCHRDLITLDRHTLEELGNCFWCSEDGPEPVYVKYPCPEIRLLAEEHQIEVS